MFYNSYKVLFSQDQICNLSSLQRFLSAIESGFERSVYNFNLYYPIRCTHVALFTFLLVQPIMYTVSLCLATVSNHRINSLNGINQSQAAHKWASQSHQLTPTLTLTYQPYEEKITSDVIDIDLLCVSCLTIILKITWTDHL